MHQSNNTNKIGSIREYAKKTLESIKRYIKRDNFLKDSRPPLLENLSVISCPKPKFVEKKITFKHSIIDMNKLTVRLGEEGIGFVEETFGLRIGEHIHISENSIFIGVDAYPELTRIVSECLIGPKELASAIKRAA
jgi:hypothetical protein